MTESRLWTERDQQGIKALESLLNINTVIMRKQQDEITALKAQLAEAQKDAARYRWLRDTAGSFQGPEVYINKEYHLGIEMAAAIDAAIKGEPK